MKEELFDNWTDKYDAWFTTEVGRYVKTYETELLLELLDPLPGEHILDAGCGTGIFTADVLDHGPKVTGLDISAPMVTRAGAKLKSLDFDAACADICALPFADSTFDKVFSMTAIEFIADGTGAIAELNRVVKSGGTVVVTTLNSLSGWAANRREKARHGHSLFQEIIFRSPDDMRLLIPEKALIKTAIHFQQDSAAEHIPYLEEQARRKQLDTGAFLAAKWHKP